MLTHLSIHNIVLIEKLVIPFESGLNVLSGETGAGKSILLDALGLALGARAESALIREGADDASVTASFSYPLPPDLQSLLQDQGLTADDPLILRRTLSRDGKSRAFLCDQPIGIALLKQIGNHLLEVHGQFETHGLLNPSTHRALLDSYAGTDKLRVQVAAAYTAWQQAITAHNTLHEARERAQAEEDYLKAAAQELEQLAPQEGEIDSLSNQRTQLQNREKITEALQATDTALAGQHGATTALAQAGKAVLRVMDKAQGLEPLLALIDRAAAEAEEACHELARQRSALDSNTETLDFIEERLFKLRALARKHQVQPEELPALRARFYDKLALLGHQDDRLTALAKQAMESRAAYFRLAEELSAKRQTAARKLETKIMTELPPLKLDRAHFTVSCARKDESQWQADGLDTISFLAATNPGQSPAPLGKIASGGELARFMLAIKVVLAKADPVPTLVFDEVDAGVGGATASAVGARLAHLGRDVQVLVVTHSPQVAARGTHHLHVEKRLKAKQATTHVLPLSAESRVEEIARMLSGSQTTKAARAAATALLEGAST